MNVFLEANGCKKNYEKVRSVVKKCYVYGCVCILEWKLLFVSCIFCGKRYLVNILICSTNVVGCILYVRECFLVKFHMLKKVDLTLNKILSH